MIKIGARVAIFFHFVVLLGCAGYHPKPLDGAAVSEGLKPLALESIRIQARMIKHPLLKPVEIDFEEGLSADEAAIVAVITNPELRSDRDRRGIAAAQLLQAGILPNPKFTYDFGTPTGGNTEGTVNSYGLALEWEVTSLISRSTKIKSARAQAASVDLDIAWKEWQAAESAKQHVYRIFFIEKQLSLACEEEKAFRENLDAVKTAVALRDMTILDLDAANAAMQKAHSQLLDISRQKEQERLALNSVLGFPPEYVVPIKEMTAFPSIDTLPPLEDIMDGLETRRLDLLALRKGYESQESNVRAAILAQFPAISIGPTYMRDTSNVITTGFTASIDLPLFDRNQGQIAIQEATRQQLYDEYIIRIFESRANAANILANIESLENEIRAGDEAIRVLRQLVSNSRDVFLKRNIDALAYYNGLDKLWSKQLEVLRLRQELADLSVALEIASGKFVVQNVDDKGSDE